MAELAALAQLRHLRRELGVDDDRLDFLEAYPADDLRRLRRAVADSLRNRHRSTFAGMARAARFLPDPLLARITERAIGPLIASKIAAELDPRHARGIVGAFPVPFLADLCRTIDAPSAAPVLQAIPPDKAVPVGIELHQRGDLDTLAGFLDVVDWSVIPPMLDVLDEESLLHVGIVAESRERLSSIFEHLDDSRVLAVVEEAVGAGLLDEVVAMVGELHAVQLARTIEIVVGAGDPLVADLVAAVGSLDEGPQRDLATTLVEVSPALARRLLALAEARGVEDLPALEVLRDGTAS